MLFGGGLFFLFATESQKQCFSRRQAKSKTVLFDLVFLTPRQKVSFGPRTQNDDFLGTLRPWARAKKTHRFSSSVRNYYFVVQKGGMQTAQETQHSQPAKQEAS